MSTLIEFDGVCKYYQMGDTLVKAADHVSFKINKGEFVAIVGQSGSGKSTCMNIIGCLDVPTAGSYKINGVEVGRMDKDQLAELRCKTFGFIFQRYNLLNSLKASENAALPAVYLGLNAEARDRRAVELLKKLDLGNKLANRPNELSGGQQQRVSIARALMNGGEIILADEPTGALDSRATDELLRVFSDISAGGQTILMVTHSVRAASRAGRVLFIKDGEVCHQLYRGGMTDDQLYQKITDALTVLQAGGERV